MADASVIIPACNAAATLPTTLAGLQSQGSMSRFEVIVIDDGSTDETLALARRSPVVTSVLRHHGGGPAMARNVGAAAASGTRLAFIDADCRPTPRWLASGLAALETADLVLGETRPEPGVPLGPYDRTLSVIGLSPLFESANLFVRRELFDSLGGFESWLGPRGGKELGEDVWFGWRARRAGARIAACSEALAYHAVFPRSVVGFMTERWRLRYFPALARRIPELRRELFDHRLFLSRRSAAFDAAAAGAAFALARRSPLAVAAAIPYGRMLFDDLREARSHGGGAGGC